MLDVQECPRADLAIAALATAAIEALVRERWSALARQKQAPLDVLAAQLDRCIVQAERAPVEDADYLALLGLQRGARTAGQVWRHLADALLPAGSPGRAAYGDAIDTLLEEGPLARRILAALGNDPTRERLRAVYARLADCLLEDRLFHVG